MRVVEYDLDDLGRMTVHEGTGRWYRYIDMTAQAEELDFFASYDKTRQAIQEIVDMPNRLIDLFIQLCLNNHGRISAS